VPSMLIFPLDRNFIRNLSNLYLLVGRCDHEKMHFKTNETTVVFKLDTNFQRIKIVFILGGLTALGPLSIDMYLPALPGIARDMQTSASLVQLSLTLFLLGLATGQLLAGPFSDIHGRRGPLLGGLIIYTLSSLLCAFSPSIGVLIVLRLIQGLAGAAGVVIARAIVRDLYSGPDMTKFISRLMLVTGAAPVLAPIAGAQLLRFTSWQGVFLVLGLVGAGLVISVSFVIPETLPDQLRSTGGINTTLLTLANLFRDRVFMGYAVAQGLVAGTMFAYISGSPFVLQNVFGVSPQVFSLLFAINSCGIIFASQFTGKLAGSIPERKLFITGTAISFTGGMALLTAILMKAPLYIILLPLFMVVSSVGIVMTTGFSLAMQNQGKVAGSASGMQGVLTFIAGALVAPLVGLGGENTALPLGLVIAAMGVGTLLCYTFLIRRQTEVG